MQEMMNSLKRRIMNLVRYLQEVLLAVAMSWDSLKQYTKSEHDQQGDTYGRASTSPIAMLGLHEWMCA